MVCQFTPIVNLPYRPTERIINSDYRGLVGLLAAALLLVLRHPALRLN